MSQTENVDYPRFEITNNADGTYNWELWSVNARCLVSVKNVSLSLSELEKRINTIKTHVEKRHFDRKKHHDDKHYLFDHVSDDPFEVLYRSKLYTSFQSVDKAIFAIQRDAPDAPIDHVDRRRL
ncbi:hypothetical protein O3Q51_16655 [Cryomorphaceae bacterium 1068]|nr:hypothetical protein [Cryomorphaceae bacterium 1068]